MKAKLDKTNPAGVHIGDYTGLGSGAMVLTHDFVRNAHMDTYIGSGCMIGANAIICPGISIGDNCIIGPGAVVMANVESGSIATGNPARVVERGIKTGKWGVRIDKLPADRVDPDVLLDTKG